MTRETTEERTPEKWRRALDVFEQVGQLNANERKTLLDSACGSDMLLRQMVKEISESNHQAEAENFMESPAVSYSPPSNDGAKMVGKIVGAYRLTRFISEGGMGLVYEAERADERFRKRVAIKLLHNEFDEFELDFFKREVQSLADLEHQNIARLIDSGELPDGRPYLVMEYVAGQNLRSLMRKEGAMPLDKIITITVQICAGLSAAHKKGIIHRDIKPANIIVAGESGELLVKILDFGVALRTKTLSADPTLQNRLIGTLAYMSPEQCDGAGRNGLTTASDIYSLGLVVYEMLTGKRTIESKSPTEIVAEHLVGRPQPPSHIRASIAPSVDRVVMKALAKSPKERYQSAPEFAAGFETAFRVPPMVSPLPNPLRRVVYSALLLAFLVAVGATVYWLWPRPPEPSPGQVSIVNPPPATTAPALPLTTRPAGLKVQLNVQNPAQLTYSGCTFALYRAEINDFPAQTTQENTLVVLINLNSRSAPKEWKYESVPPGEYLTKFACVGFKTVKQKVRVAADPRHPGYATVPVRLERE